MNAPPKAAKNSASTLQAKREWKGWYNLAIWRRVKDHFRSTQPMRSVICQWPDPTRPFGICGRPATDIDHVIPHRGDWDLFVGGEGYSNLQGLCHAHHSEKTAREGGFGNGQ